jgi:hypothetical protein
MRTIKTNYVTDKVLPLIICILLAQMTAGSPCIDAGDPNFVPDPNAPTDIDGEDRVIGGRVDIGADEFLDSDGDGLPDFWEQRYFGDPHAADPNADPDGDGLTNIQEYEEYGSHPDAPPYYVDRKRGKDRYNGLSPKPHGKYVGPKRDIQSAIDAASDGDTIMVAPGTYTGSGNMELDFTGKSIVLRAHKGRHKKKGRDKAIIDCQGSGRAVALEGIKGIFAVLEGFTIRGANADVGGAIRTENSRVMLKDCVLTASTAADKAGGIYSYLSTPTISNLILWDNSAPNEPNTGLLEFSNINLQGDLTVETGRLDVKSSWFYGPGRLNLEEGTLLAGTGSPGINPTVIRTDVNGTGDIEIYAGQQLIIEGDAVVDLSGSGECNPDAYTGGLITVEGSLVVRGNASLVNSDVNVVLLDIKGAHNIQFNNIKLLEASTGFGGEFFVDGSATISCNNIISEGDRYLDLDPDPDSADRPTISDNRITVIIKEGTLSSRGTLLELRAADYDCGYEGAVNLDCSSGAYQVPASSAGFTDDPSENWVLEELILEENAKLNLTNRQGFVFQDFNDVWTDVETVYVKELVMGPRSVLNIALQTLYYQRLVDPNGVELFRDPCDPYAPLANGARFEDIPLLGFSLGIIAMDDTAPSPHNEFDIRVRKRLRDPHDIQPENCEDKGNCLEGSIERLDMYDDPTIPVDAGGVMEMRTKALGKQSASSVAAKGAFARAGDEDITIEFEYMFLDDPCDEAEIVIYLSDDPEVSRNIVEVARIRPPASDRPGSISSGRFAVFSGTFPRGDLNFTRGTYVELELRGRRARCWIENWDPIIFCSTTCGNYNGITGVDIFDYFLLLAELGLSGPGGVGKGCLDLVTDGCVDTEDRLAWDIPELLNKCPQGWLSSGGVSGGIAARQASPSPLEPEIESSVADESLIVFGQSLIAGGDTDGPSSHLYDIDTTGTCLGTPASGAGTGRLVSDGRGNTYQIDSYAGLVDQNGVIVVEPKTNIGYEDKFVSVGLAGGGLLLTDAAFDPDRPNIVYVVPVLVNAPNTCSYMAAAKLKLKRAGDYELLKLYGKNPSEQGGPYLTDCEGQIVYNPDFQHLHEIEVDSDGNNVFVLSFVLSSHPDYRQGDPNYSKYDNWILIYNEATGNDSEVPVLLSDPNDIYPDVIGPTAMVVSSVQDKLYLASSAHEQNDPNDLITEVYCFSVDKTDSDVNLVYENTVQIACPEPATNICGGSWDLCEPDRFVSTITSMTEDPGDGTLYVTGFTAPKFKEDAVFPPFGIDFFTTPMLAVVSPDSNDLVKATAIEGCDLALPLSIVWTVSDPNADTCRNPDECAGQSNGDATCDGNVNLADLFALKASFGKCAPWTPPECCPDFTQDNCINLADLFTLKAGFGSSGYSPSTGNQNCPP